MNVNSKTLLFEGIESNPTLCGEMYALCNDIVLKGKLPAEQPDWMVEWLLVASPSGQHALVMISTVMVLRVYMSLLIAGWSPVNDEICVIEGCRQPSMHEGA